MNHAALSSSSWKPASEPARIEMAVPFPGLVDVQLELPFHLFDHGRLVGGIRPRVPIVIGRQVALVQRANGAGDFVDLLGAGSTIHSKPTASCIGESTPLRRSRRTSESTWMLILPWRAVKAAFHSDQPVRPVVECRTSTLSLSPSTSERIATRGNRARYRRCPRSCV